MTFVESLGILQPSQQRLLVKALSANIISEPSQLLALMPLRLLKMTEVRLQSDKYI
jgi:hypothetical protein